MPMLTFPAIFVKGIFLGGLEQLQDAVSSSKFIELLASQRQPGDKREIPDPKVLFKGPRGQPWYCFQLHVFTNFIRALSMLHVALFAISAAVSFSAPAASYVILWIVVVDLVVFFLTGPTPLAPLSTLVTLAVWRFRGNAATSFPYKFIFAVYIFTLVTTLLANSTSSFDDAARTALSGLVLNSSLLAFFRF